MENKAKTFLTLFSTLVVKVHFEFHTNNFLFQIVFEGKIVKS